MYIYNIYFIYMKGHIFLSIYDFFPQKAVQKLPCILE